MTPSPRQLSAGYVPAQILYVTAELGIADALADGAPDSRTVAERTGADPAAVRRLLRALVGLGVAVQHDADRFGLTEFGELLRSDVPDSARDDIVLSVTPGLWRAWGDLKRVIQTGAPGRATDDGLTAREVIMRDPVLGASWRAGKASSANEFADGVGKVYDFSGFGTIAAYCGDEGTLIAAILSSAPGPLAVVHDRPEAFERTLATLTAAGVADRCELQQGDVAESVPAGADAYLLSHIIRDHTDDKAVAILRNCRAAMAANSRLLLVETVMPAVIAAEHSATYGLTDLNNLVYTGGTERDEAEYRALLAAAGLELVSLTDVPTVNGLPNYNIIDVVAAG